MTGLVPILEAIASHAGATGCCLVPCRAGLLGCDPPVVAGGPEAERLLDAWSEAMPVPGRSGGELAQRLVALFSQRRRIGARRLLLRLVLPDAGGAQLLIERGGEPGAVSALALSLDALAAALRPAPQPQELHDACAFVSRDPRLLLLTDREGRPLAVSPALRLQLGVERAGRPVPLGREAARFLEQVRSTPPGGVVSVEGLGGGGTLRIEPHLDGSFLLAVIEGEVAQMATLRLLSNGEVTPREITCGLRLAEGKSYREIATDLGVSPDTVKLHLRALYQKLAVDGRDGLVARLAGLAPPPPIARVRYGTRVS